MSTTITVNRKRKYPQKARKGKRGAPYLPPPVRRIERKYIDYSNSSAFGTSWALLESSAIPISAIAQGNGQSNRDGRSCVLLSALVRWQIYTNGDDTATEDDAPFMARVALVLDRQANGATITPGGTPGTLFESNNVLSPLNLQNTNRFTVLRDWMCTLPARTITNHHTNNTYVMNGQIRSKEWFSKFEINVNHLNTTAAMASIADCCLRLVGIANSALVNYAFYSRVRFCD